MECKDFRPLYRGRRVRCGNCRRWVANLKSYTNSRPVPTETPCKGKS